MIIIGIVNEKGGAGKTTTAVNYFGCLSNMGISSVLIDTDIKGKAANIIAQSGNGSLSKNVYSCPGGDYNQLVETIRLSTNDHTQVVLIDTPPGIGEEINNVIYVSNKLVIPAKTSIQDREISIKTAQYLIRATEGKDKPIYFQPTQIKVGQIMSDVSVDAYENMEGTFCLHPIREAAAIEKAGNEGLSVFEFDTKAKVLEDYEKSISQLIG